MSDETEVKQAEVKRLDEFAKKKAQEDMARTMAFNQQVLGGAAIGGGLYSPQPYPTQNSESILAEAIGNLAHILQGLARYDLEALNKLRQVIKDTIKELL